MWTLVDSTRPERLRIFSSHAMGMKALVGVNFWSRNVIPDDSRQFWRMFYGTEGRAKTVPLHVSVYLDGVDADGFWNTMKEQYRQIRRWAYGIIDFPYIMEQNAVSPKIPLGLRIAQTYRQLSQFHLWAVVPLLLMTLRPIAGAVEPVAVHSSWMVADLAALAILASGVLSPLGLGVSAIVALKLLPVRPSHRPPGTWLRMAGGVAGAADRGADLLLRSGDRRPAPADGAPLSRLPGHGEAPDPRRPHDALTQAQISRTSRDRWRSTHSRSTHRSSGAG